MCVMTTLSAIGAGTMAAISAIGSATAAAGTAVGGMAAAGATAMGVGSAAAATTGGVVAGLTTGAINGALIGTAAGAIGGAVTGQGAGRGALMGAGFGAAGGALVSGAGMALNGVDQLAVTGNGANPLSWSGASHAYNGAPGVVTKTGGLVSDGGTTTTMNGEQFTLVSDESGQHWVASAELAKEAGAEGGASGVSAEAGVNGGDLAQAGLKMAGEGVKSGLQGYAAVQQGKADAASLKDQAKLKNWQAQMEKENADVQIQDTRRRYRQLRGSGRAAAAANGMLVEGSNVSMWEQDLASEAAYDSWKIAENANRNAWGYRQNARQLTAQANQARRTGNLRATTALISAPFSMLGSAGSLFA